MSNYDFGNSVIRPKQKNGNGKYDYDNNGIFSSDQDEVKSPAKYSHPLIFNTKFGRMADNNVIAYQLYNSFNYSLCLPDNSKTMKCSFGITSPNHGEGKTTTACNFAAALSLGLNRKTVLIDLNLNNPSIHEIFGMSQGPGLSDALLGEEIFITPTQIENLSIITAGFTKIIPTKKLTGFNEIAGSLFNEYEFIIVDMPSLEMRSFPTLIANQLTGLIVVVEARKTKRRDVARIFRQVNEKNILGFVINKINEEDF